ncbi:fimbrial protein, partial [Escherichia coli]|nr:fimbrial protein [Escherichia coli]EEW0979479.1 fimbrial protein [Escherichia coli]EFD0671019.1 fimbrial protein [Escherichia coli]EFD5270001.1 fimbrial protein [Escherichia coli]EFE7894364.1 fimbrial protein [Escherichia coli]
MRKRLAINFSGALFLVVLSIPSFAGSVQRTIFNADVVASA